MDTSTYALFSNLSHIKPPSVTSQINTCFLYFGVVNFWGLFILEKISLFDIIYYIEKLFLDVM